MFRTLQLTSQQNFLLDKPENHAIICYKAMMKTAMRYSTSESRRLVQDGGENAVDAHPFGAEDANVKQVVSSEQRSVSAKGVSGLL